MGESVVIVGGGTSGSVLANRLSADPERTVVLLERGPDDSTYGDDVGDPARAHLFGWLGTHAELHQTNQGAGQSIAIAGATLGGTSAVNYLATVRGQPRDYDAWAAAGVTGWGWDDVGDAFVRAEHDHDLPDSPLHGASGPLPVRRWRPEEGAPFHRAFTDGLRSLGVPAVADVNDPSCLPGVGTFPATVDPVTLRRVTVSQAFLTAEVRSRPNLEIACDTGVRRVVVEDGRAVGVETLDGEVVRADRVVSCAGAIGSATLLQRSGIGPRSVLESAGVEVVADVAGVGGNLQDHLGTMVQYTMPGPVAMVGSPAQSLWIDSSEAGVDVHVFPMPLSDVGGDEVTFVVALYLLRLRGRGTVEITSPDVAAPPVIRMPDVAADELARLDPIYAVLDRWERTDAFAALGARRTHPTGSLARPAALHPGPYQPYLHLAGTCAMGADDDPAAVLDARCRVRGVPGLAVVDAASMPTAPAGNTYLGCVMVAERAAARW